MNPVTRLILNLGIILLNVFTIATTKAPVMFLVCTGIILVSLWAIKVSIEQINAIEDKEKKFSNKKTEPKKNKSSVKKL